MPTQEERRAFEDRLIAALSDAETKLALAREAVGELSPLLTIGRQLWNIDLLRANRLKSEVLSAMGTVAQAEIVVYGAHTEILEITHQG